MDYFSIKRPIFIVPSEKCSVEFEKIDKFMILLEKSGVGKIIEYVSIMIKTVKEEDDIILITFLQLLYTALQNLMLH